MSKKPYLKLVKMPEPDFHIVASWYPEENEPMPENYDAEDLSIWDTNIDKKAIAKGAGLYTAAVHHHNGQSYMIAWPTNREGPTMGEVFGYNINQYTENEDQQVQPQARFDLQTDGTWKLAPEKLTEIEDAAANLAIDKAMDAVSAIGEMEQQVRIAFKQKFVDSVCHDLDDITTMLNNKRDAIRNKLGY